MFCRKCGSNIPDDSSFCYKCGKGVETSSTAVVSQTATQLSTNQDKLDTKGTIEYLKMVCCLENDKFALERTKENLKYKTQTYGLGRNIYRPAKEKSQFEFLDHFGIIIIGAILGYIGGVTTLSITGSGGIIIGLLMGWFYLNTWTGVGIGIAIALAIIALIAIKDASTALKENKMMKTKYINEVIADKARVEREKKCIPIFLAHIDEIDDKIAILENSLNKLYAYNIIFKKYRGDVVALNTIYEYFLSGRVYSLSATGFSGNDGAYNLYENELRQNIIINKLDIIINQLEQIKANQRMLYDAIQEANSIASDISRMADKISAVADNTAMAAYNAKISADNSSALKYMALWKL